MDDKRVVAIAEGVLRRQKAKDQELFVRNNSSRRGGLSQLNVVGNGNVDGGRADEIYTPPQKLDGGTANG